MRTRCLQVYQQCSKMASIMRLSSSVRPTFGRANSRRAVVVRAERKRECSIF